MQKIWILLLALCVATGYANMKENADSKTTGTPETLGTYISWSEAYQDFVNSGKFLTVDFPYHAETASICGDPPPWGTDYTPGISLWDLDLDGIPELMISNGQGAALESCVYVYTFTGGRIEYTGHCHCRPDISYVPQYSGVLFNFCAGSGTGSVSLCTKDGNTIRKEMIYSYEWDSEGEREERVTADDTLYVSAKNSTAPLYSATADQITSMGWDAFAMKSSNEQNGRQN